MALAPVNTRLVNRLSMGLLGKWLLTHSILFTISSGTTRLIMTMTLGSGRGITIWFFVETCLLWANSILVFVQHQSLGMVDQCYCYLPFHANRDERIY